MTREHGHQERLSLRKHLNSCLTSLFSYSVIQLTSLSLESNQLHSSWCHHYYLFYATGSCFASLMKWGEKSYFIYLFLTLRSILRTIAVPLITCQCPVMEMVCGTCQEGSPNIVESSMHSPLGSCGPGQTRRGKESTRLSRVQEHKHHVLNLHHSHAADGNTHT